MIRTAVIRGRRYRIVNRPGWGNLGYCEHPKSPGKRMSIPVRGDTQEALYTILHETLHAGLWDLDEETVEEMCHDQARLLWRLGWRRQGD